MGGFHRVFGVGVWGGGGVGGGFWGGGGGGTADDNPFADDHLPRDISASLELEESASCLVLHQPRQMSDLLGVLSRAGRHSVNGAWMGRWHGIQSWIGIGSEAIQKVGLWGGGGGECVHE